MKQNVARMHRPSVVGGNPARPIKHRFDPERARALLEIAWWDWPIARITAHLELIVSGDIEALKAANP